MCDGSPLVQKDPVIPTRAAGGLYERKNSKYPATHAYDGRIIAEGLGPRAHKHTWSDETFYMLDGETTATKSRRREPVTAFSPR